MNLKGTISKHKLCCMWWT